MSEPRSTQGQAVIAEAARLLQEIHFSHLHGAYAEGQHVAVSVDPRWNDDAETFRTLISCITLGHRQINWTRLPIQVAPEQRGGMHALSRLNARGQALIPNLPPGEYRLTLRFKQMQAVPVLSHTVDKLAAQGEDEEYERRVWRGESEDGLVTWSLEETEEGEVQIAFETQDASLADQRVVFQLIDPTSKQTCYRQQLAFQSTRTPNKWEAWCIIGSQADFPGPYELTFELEPPDATNTEG